MKSVTFIIKVMNGWGAERVISVLGNHLVQYGYDVTIIITHQSYADAQLELINPKIRVIALENEISQNNTVIKTLIMQKTRFIGKIYRVLFRDGDEKYLVEKYRARNCEKVRYLKKYFSLNIKTVAVAFINDSIYLTLLSAKKTNRIIISERGDPQQCLSSKTNRAFFKVMYPKADEMIFQSPGAMQWYKQNTNVTGRVIFNPIMPNLPKKSSGKRNNCIVNFCRITPQKKLDTLIEAFEIFAESYSDYELYIYGNSDPAEPEYIHFIKNKINSVSHKDRIHLVPAQKDIHDKIIDSAMFVSSSYYEGMSNSMLEAMAIGIPTICTDCPAGGARAVIKDHENGILLPVNDVQAMADAMKEIVDNPDLAEKLSLNGKKIRKDLSIDKIVYQWMESIDG